MSRLFIWTFRLLLLLGTAFFLCTAPASSLAGEITEKNDKGDVLIEDFSSYSAGAFPDGWEAKGGRKKGEAVYRIEKEGDNAYLMAHSRGVDVQLAKKIPGWSLAQHPRLSWKWRVVKFPDGSDERRRATNDSPVAVYVLFQHFILPKALKYIWSATVPAGASFWSPHGSKARIIVLESGGDKKGQWVAETVNVYEDYKRFFEEEPPEVLGIAVMTDSDSTETSAIGMYDDFRLLPRPDFPPP